MNAMDVSHLLAKPFKNEQYQSYLAMLGDTENKNTKGIPVPSADSFDVNDELVFANMVIINSMPIMVDSKQIPMKLSQVLQRFAYLSATRPNSVYSLRFASMLNLVVNKAVELKIEDKLTKLTSQLLVQENETKKWFRIAHEWKALHQDGVKEKEKVETELQQRVIMLTQENTDLVAQIDTKKTELSTLGYELYERVKQKEGLQAQNDYLLAQLAKAHKQHQEAEEKLRVKSRKNKELYKRLQTTAK